MFELEKSIVEWRQEMFLAGLKRSDVLDELESHLREQTARLTNTGISESAAFHAAVLELGESQALRCEFSKVSRPRFWIRRDNPLALNLLAAWFIINGLNVAVGTLPLLYSVSLPALYFFSPYGNHADFSLGLLSVYVRSFFVFGMLLLTGVGLYRRQNLWRICALVLPMLMVAGMFLHFIHSPSAYLSYLQRLWITDYDMPYRFMGLFVPPVVFYIHMLINLPILLWGCYLLTRPSIRNLFRPDGKVKTA